MLQMNVLRETVLQLSWAKEKPTDMKILSLGWFVGVEVAKKCLQ